MVGSVVLGGALAPKLENQWRPATLAQATLRLLTSVPNASAFQFRSLLLYLGFVLLCLGVFITATLWFLFIFGAPVALLGLVLILVSGQPAWRIVLAILFPFGAWVGTAMAALALAPREQGTTYLIPEGFEGTIMVVKNEPCAPPTEHADGRLLYRVPASGLLLVRDTVPNRQHPYYSWPNKGYFLQSDNKYFVVDRQGRRLRELTEVRTSTTEGGNPEATTAWKNVGRDDLALFYDGPVAMLPDSTSLRYTFQYLTVTTQNRYEQPSMYDSQARVRALADSLVPRCRGRSGQLPQQLRQPPPSSP